MDSIGRFPLSVVLSFLGETEGTSFLITRKLFAWKTLPIFRLKDMKMNGLLDAKKSATNKRKHRHRFVEYSAQDSTVLLARLNTRRIHRRSLMCSSKSCRALGKTTRQLSRDEPRNGSWPVDLELLRFLTPKESKQFNGVATALVSYPRSGNTLMRNLLERITGIVTGSDNRPDRALSRALALDHNLVGEGVTRCVHIVKTHYPERPGFSFQTDRAILLVRNPYDAIDSYWNLNLTNTHTETVTDEVYRQHADTFQALARNEMRVWIRFHLYWLQSGIPIHIVRFEDLISGTKSEMEKLCSILGSTDYQSRVSHAVGIDSSKMGSYRPRTTSSVPYGKSLAKGRYSTELLKELLEIAQKEGCLHGKTMLQRFGYDIETQGFPSNFVDKKPSAIDVEGLSCDKKQMQEITVNSGFQLRDITDPFGRTMRQWRLDHTNNDTKPFPTVSRD